MDEKWMKNIREKKRTKKWTLKKKDGKKEQKNNEKRTQKEAENPKRRPVSPRTQQSNTYPSTFKKGTGCISCAVQEIIAVNLQLKTPRLLPSGAVDCKNNDRKRKQKWGGLEVPGFGGKKDLKREEKKGK